MFFLEIARVEKIHIPAWQNIVNKGVYWKTGQVLYHEDLAEIMFLKPNTSSYYYHMRKAKDELTKIGIRIVPIKGVGYNVLNSDEWIKEIKNKISKSFKSLKEAELLVNNAPYLKMSEEAKEECLKIQSMIIKQKLLLKSGMVQIENKKQNQLPEK